LAFGRVIPLRKLLRATSIVKQQANITGELWSAFANAGDASILAEIANVSPARRVGAISAAHCAVRTDANAPGDVPPNWREDIRFKKWWATLRHYQPSVAKFRNFGYAITGNRIGAGCSHRGGHHEIVARLCRAIRRRCRVNEPAVRPGRVTNRNRRRHLASQDHGRSAEAGGKATSASAGGISPDIVDRSNLYRSNLYRSHVDRSNVIGFAGSDHGRARFDIGQACQPGEDQQQLQRWLPNELQNPERPLGRV
jgi:hypothetical protein